MAGRSRRIPLRRIAGQSGAGLLLAVAGYFGGIAATTLVPAHTSTTFYQAEVSLSPVPDSTLEAPSLLGTVRVQFDGLLPAPRVVMNASIKPNIESVFSQGTPSPDTFKPTNSQLTEAISAAVSGLAIRFVIGFVLTIALLLAAHRLARRAPLRSYAAPVAVAVAFGAIGPAISCWTTYRKSNVQAISATSLLGLVQRNSGMLGDIEKRTAESSRYVSSALGVAAALQDIFHPGKEDTKPALRVLLVSDIHGINQYALLKTIVRTEIRTGTYSFDIATFDATCSLASLHRFTFKGILQGNPDLQSATVLAGSGIVPAAKTASVAAGAALRS